MTVTMNFEDLESADDLALGASSWLEITQEMIDAFAVLTGDDQWVHVDVERASNGPFGTTIAHGFLVLAIVPLLLRQLLTVSDVRMGLNYGLDGLRFTCPVRAGARVRAVATLKSVVRRGEGLLLRQAVAVEIEGEERPALVAELLFLRYP